MSGDWAKIELNTPDKPEVWLIADLLEIDPDAAFGKVFRVWAWFDEHTENGNAPSVTKRLLDRQVGVTGFCDAMLQAGWMQEKDGVIGLPNFDKHNGNSAKKRANTNRRVAQHRENKGVSACNAKGVTKSVTREEKRREDIKENIKKKKSSEAQLDFSSWPDMPSEQKLKDWKQLRKTKKAPVSQTVLNKFGKELAKAKELGFSVEDCFEQIIIKSWQGFEADWMLKAVSQSAGAHQPTPPRRAMPKPGDL